MTKIASTFYSAKSIETIRNNIKKYDWAAEMARNIVGVAEPWAAITDEQLWSAMFGNTISRSWMVLSNGKCPSCAGDVPMYNWIVDPFAHPWKLKCPHCAELFPKNDFEAFYRSGLDGQGVFQPEKADRSLLFNAEHPDAGDPLRDFCVDDGEGCEVPDGPAGQRWRFIGAYLIYGQWKKYIVEGIVKLANAWVVTGEASYARKALIMLDRVADLYPTFDFGAEGVMYEGKADAGYISTWHDANVEAKSLCLAYDMIFDSASSNSEAVEFLSRKASEHGLDNAKRSFADVRRNIEERILKDTLAHPAKVKLNFPGTETLLVIIRAILDWPETRESILADVYTIIAKATAVDGVTGEKGLSAYSSYTIMTLTDRLNIFRLIDSNFLRDAIEAVPTLKQTYKFFIDTWCLGKYYPQAGDAGSFMMPEPVYKAVDFDGKASASAQAAKNVMPTGFSYMWDLWQATGDPDYIKLIYRHNDYCVKSLPYDLTCEDAAEIQRVTAEIIAAEGTQFKQESVNKENWHIAVLKSGEGDNGRAVWMKYDSGGLHGQDDGMNLGLFAYGLDLMPDFGYPPVQMGGGWRSKYVAWNASTAAHNTALVDGRGDRRGRSGTTKLWGIGKGLKAIRVDAPELVSQEKFERTVCLADIDDKDCYIIDIFRIRGGHDHAKFMHSATGTMTVTGLTTRPTPDFNENALMRDFKTDVSPAEGWSADWHVEDYHKVLPAGSEVHLRYTDFTRDAEASTCEAWVNAAGFIETDERWIPRLMIRRKNAGDEPLASTFAGVIEPYGSSRRVTGIRRIDLGEDSAVALEIKLAGGRTDYIIALDPEKTPAARLNEHQIELEGELCMVSIVNGAVARMVLMNGTRLKAGDAVLLSEQKAAVTEAEFIIK